MFLPSYNYSVTAPLPKVLRVTRSCCILIDMDLTRMLSKNILRERSSPWLSLLLNPYNLYYSLMAPLPKATPEGYKILLYKLADPDPSKLVFEDGLKAFFAFNDVRISEDGLTEGYIVVFDMKGCSLGHLARVSTCMNLVRKFMVYIQVSPNAQHSLL